eukprot:scaffold414438_cov43-Prasinocladus_malaysianus.AAC.2
MKAANGAAALQYTSQSALSFADNSKLSLAMSSDHCLKNIREVCASFNWNVWLQVTSWSQNSTGGTRHQSGTDIAYGARPKCQIQAWRDQWSTPLPSACSIH